MALAHGGDGSLVVTPLDFALPMGEVVGNAQNVVISKRTMGNVSAHRISALIILRRLVLVTSPGL